MHPPPAVKMAPHAPRGAPQQQQQQVQGPQQLQGPQTAAGHSHPAVISLKKEIGVALDASQPLAARCTSLGKLHAVMSSHQANRPGVAVAMLPLFLSSWPQLMACLWDPATPQLAAAAAPLMGIVGALVTSSRALAAAADAAAAAAAAAAQSHTTDPAPPAPAAPAAFTHGPPPPPSRLLFDWLLPLLTGAVPLPTGAPAPPQLQALLCKTLVYALQQLPSCSAAADTVHQQRPAPQAAGDAPSTSQQQASATNQNQLQATTGQQQQQQDTPAAAASTTAAGGVGAASAAQEKLLTAPVPPAAAALLQQHAAAVMAAVQQLLEAVSTPPELLGPLLQLLLEVIRLAHKVVTGAVLRDLVDLLLGWSLEPGLQAKDRHLITRVLTALRPSWQSEPQLAQDVAGKLLVDLKHLLPPPPPAAAQSLLPQSTAPSTPAPVTGPSASAEMAVGEAGVPAPADAAPGQSSEQLQQQQQQHHQLQQQLQEQLQKLLSLLSCLVAIVKASYATPGQQQLMAKAMQFVAAAHGRVAAHAAAAAAGNAVPSSTWSSAATSLAGSMLALWEGVVGQSAMPGASIAAPSTAAGAGSSTDSGQSMLGAEEGTWDQGRATAGTETAPTETSDRQQQAGDLEAPTDGTAAPGCDASSVSERCWALVLATVQLPLLAVEDAVGLLASINRALAVAGDAVLSATSSKSSSGSCAGGETAAGDQRSMQGTDAEDQKQQQQEIVQDAGWVGQVSGPGVVPKQLPLKLWRVTKVYRCSPLADVQAAVAATYTAAVLLSNAHTSMHSNAFGSSAGGSTAAVNDVMQAVLEEVSVLCTTLAHSEAGDSSSSSTAKADVGQQTGPPAAAQADADAYENESTSTAAAATAGMQASRPKASASDFQGLTGTRQQERVAMLLFDLALLESWISCAANTAGDQELPSHGEADMRAEPPQAASTAAGVVGRCAGTAAGDIAEAVLAGLQQLLREPQQQGAQHAQWLGAVGPCVDAVIDELLALLQALLVLVLPSSPAPVTHIAGPDPLSSPPTQGAIVSAVVSCLELLVTAVDLGIGHKVAAVQMLSQLLTSAALQQMSARGSSTLADITAALQPALVVLWCAAAAAAAEVRAAATEAAGRAAAAALQSMQGPLQDHTAAAASKLLESCAELLASRCADVHEGVASAAQAHTTKLVLPLYLLAACSGASSLSDRSSTGQASSSSSVDSAAASAAGMCARWKRLAALQPQQRLFKAPQLAQLFDVSFHASPAMLQRYTHRTAAQQQQQQLPPQARYATKTAALHRLAQCLPLLPASGGSSTNRNSSSSADILHFEDLSSAAVTSWLLTQEAARQCVGARMRTHFGNPTQSFGSLERVVQVLLQQLQCDGSFCAQQRSWQRQLLLQIQAATPQQQQQQQHQQAVSGQQAEPQQLLQAPGASVAAAGGASGAANVSQSRPRLQQQIGGSGGDNRAAAAASAGSGLDASALGVEESRSETEAAVCSLLDFMYALEVNMLTAIEGSLMRPPVSKSVMAFFAGNRKVCEDWFSRTRESLLRLSAAVGAHQHVMFHGMARLTELHSQLKALTAHSQAQQQLLQQERERQKAQQQEGSASAAAAAAAAAAAISGLGAGSQQQQPNARARDRQQQQQAIGKASSNTEQRKLKGRQGTAAHAVETAQQTSNTGAAAAAEAAGATAATVPVSEKLRLLQQQYQAALLQLAGPVLSTLVLLADAAVAAGEPHVVLGLQRWVHQGFHAVWETVSQLYSLDILAAAAGFNEDDLQDLDDYLEVGAGNAAGGTSKGSAAGSSTGQQQQQQTAAPSMLLLSWLPAAAAQAAGRYEDALQLYGSFLASEACSTGLGGATKPWIQEQMAACYAALADWQGLGDLCNAVRGFGQQQQQQGVQESAAVPWLQHWQLAGVVGLMHLQSWCMPGSAHEQQHRAGLQVIEQHLSGPSRGGRLGGRNRGADQGQHDAGLQNSSSEMLWQYRLDLQQSCGAAASQAALAVLHATAALGMCASSAEAVSTNASSSTGREGLQQGRQQGPVSPRGRAGKGRDRGKQGLMQPTAATMAAAVQHQQQLLMQAVTDIRQQLGALQSNPFVALPGVCSVFDTNSSSLVTHSTLQQLSIMQLLQEQLMHSLQPGQQGQQGPSTEQVGNMLSCFSLLSDRDVQTSSSNSGLAVDSIWSDGLRQDGKLAASLFGDVASTTALLQCLPGAGAAGNSNSGTRAARLQLLREAILASSAHGCSNTLQRLLQLAAAESSSCSLQEQQWLQLLSTKLHPLPSAGATAAHKAVEAHLMVLQHDLDRLVAPRSTSRSSSSSAGGPGDNCDAASLAAAYLSLGAILEQAAQHSSWQEIQSMCPAFAQVDWHSVGSAADRDLPQLADRPGMSSTAASMGYLQDRPQQQAALACMAAAVALRPHHPVPWKSYGDMLFGLAGASSQTTAVDGAGTVAGAFVSAQHGHSDASILGAAADAYCQHLAASANTGALTSPQQSLGVLLKLLQIILQHGEQLQDKLSAPLGACPAAVWQVLTSQLLAQLQHSSPAVRALIQQLLQGLAVVVPCAVLYPLVVEVRAAQEAGTQVPDEVSAVVSQLQRVQQRMMADTVAMAEALEGLTVTRWEAWTGLLVELSLETNRKLLSLRADVSRQDQKHMTPAKRMEVFLNRYNTMMTPVITSLQQHITAATANPPASPDDTIFRQEMLPQLTALLESLRQPPKDLLKLASGEQSDDEDSEGATDDPASATATNLGKQQQQDQTASVSAAGDAAGKAVDSSGWPLLKQLRLQLQQHLRRQQHLQLAAVAPQLSKLRNTAIPLPADDLTDVMLPPLLLKVALERYATGGSAAAAVASTTGASALLAATGQTSAGSEADVASTAAAAGTSNSSGSWLCIAAFDKQVAVLPTKTRPKRLLLMASDGTVHAFLLKGRDDLRVDERLMQFMRASNALLSTDQDMQPAAVCASQALAPASAAAAAVAGWSGKSRQPLRVRPYSITPFGRRAGLVQWVRHTTSLYGLFRSWQQCTAERYQAVAAGKRDAAAAAAAAAASAAAASSEGQAGQGPGLASTSDKGPDAGASAGAGATVQLPLIVAASRPTDAFYARLLPALQAAGLPVGSARSSWPASVLRSTFASLAREAPKALLARQLLSGAAEPGAWWSCQQAFTASAAAGSIVGWLLGLGDRHMDNLLLDRDSCELVHIDFSVCFDKGASLAVPEVVPFRLTQGMQVALGPGGLQGPFSAAAATVLARLRSSADLLCGLLQLLLSDTAVDWSVDREAHAARKDQDTAVGLRLCASRLEELRHPLLANLAAALPTIGNGLAAVVSYGEAHLFIIQLQAQAAAAHARAAAGSQTIADAAADEVRALTSGANAAKDVTVLTADYRRLCGLAASCIQSAGSWLERHVETLHALGATAAAGSTSSGSGLQSLLAARGSDWDVVAADRSLLLLTGNAAAAGGSSDPSTTQGLLLQVLRSFLPSAGTAPGVLIGAGATSQLAADLEGLLPVELVQHCMQLDGQGVQLLQQQQELIKQGRLSLAAYAAVLTQLLSGGEAYIRFSHHWAWSAAFTTGAAGPDMHIVNTAASTAPQLPTHDQVAATWVCLAACWGAACLAQQQQEAALTASTAAVATAGGAGMTAGLASGASVLSALPAAEGDPAEQLSTALRQLSAKMQSSSAEVDAAEVQFVASTALATACQAAQDAAAAAKEWAHGAPGRLATPAQQQLQSEPAAVGLIPGNLSSTVPRELQALQLQLAALQTALVEYEQSGLAFILDPSASTLTHELPDADLGLEELLDSGDIEKAAALLAGKQPAGQQHWQQQLQAASSQLQMLPQLLTALQYEALGPIAVWQAAAGPGLGSQSAGSALQEASQQSGGQHQRQPQDQLQPLPLLPAGTVSQQQLWHAAAAHVQQHWQQLEQLLQQAVELEGHMHALAAVAAAGGAASIWPDDNDLLTKAIALQQMLLPQGFDILTTDECVASAQLLQAQWGDLEHRLRLTADAALSPLLGLQGQQQQAGMGSAAAAGVQDPGAQLALLLEAAAASVSGGSILHCKDVVEALAAGADGAGRGDAGSNSSNLWGVPGVSDAWRCLVVLLLQYACMQQQLLQTQQQAEVAGTAGGDAAADNGCFDVLRGTKALPMEIEAHRPVLVAVQVLYELLCDSAQLDAEPTPTTAAHKDPSAAAVPDQIAADGAAGHATSLQQALQDILLPPLLPQVLSVLQLPLHFLQQHLSTLADESAAVLSRFQQPSSPQQQQRPGGAMGRVIQDDSEPSAGYSSGLAAGTASAEDADLVPFDAFDESLPGADMVLEDLGEGSDDASTMWGDAGLGDAQDGSAEGQTGTAAAAGTAGQGLPELVPFNAFNEGLAGAGVSLEGGTEADLGQGGFFGAMEGGDLLGGALEDEQTGLEGEHTAVQSSNRHSNSHGGAAHVPDADAAAQELGQTLLTAGHHAAAAALLQQQLAALQQVEATCAWQQQVWLRHLAAFEWLWGDLLPLQHQQQAAPGCQSAEHLAAQKHMLLDAAAKALGWCIESKPASGSSNSSVGGEAEAPISEQHGQAGVGPAMAPGHAYQLFCAQLLPQLPLQPNHVVASSSSGGAGHSENIQQHQRMPTGPELLQSWRALCEQQSAVGDALRAWQAGCAAAAAAVGDALLGAAGPPVIQLADPTVCRKMLSGAVARAGHWVEGAVALCSSLSQQAEAALQLEYSRRGSLWAPGMPDGVDAFQGNASLMQQMVAAATALSQSQADVAAAEALLASSQAAAAQAQVTIEESVAEAAAVEQQLVSKTPAALVRAQGMVPMLQPMVAAAEAALPFVTDSLGSTLRALVTLVERNSAARDLAPVVKAVCLQHGRSLRVLQRLHEIGAAAVTGLSNVMQSMQLWRQQQGLFQELQETAAAVLAPSSPAHDAQALQLLLAHMQPALAGVREELGELGQAHVLFTHLTEQLDSLAGAAETVAAAITSDHALQLPAAAQGRLMTDGSSTGSSSTGRKQRAEARQRAFAAAALARCTARLTGQRPASKPSTNAEVPAAAAAQAGSSTAVFTTRSVPDEVSALVAAATSVDKLSRMYEGWAAWL